MIKKIIMFNLLGNNREMSMTHLREDKTIYKLGKERAGSSDKNDRD